MKRVKLTQNRYAVVDDEDFTCLNRVQWHFTHGYARGKNRVYMHRMIMNATSDQVIDHINGDTLDNRKENLRVACKSLNGYNRASVGSRNTSGVTGVSWYEPSKKWRVRVGTRHIGHYKSFSVAKKKREESLAKAINNATRKQSLI